MIMFPCKDCGKETATSEEYFMVSNWLWNTFCSDAGFLCLDCLQKRIGRKLYKGDFMNLKMNEKIMERFGDG